jgi:hypothetical protein
LHGGSLGKGSDLTIASGVPKAMCLISFEIAKGDHVANPTRRLRNGGTGTWQPARIHAL